ncbi:MAG: DUF805 domain-containing protein [Desulfobulbaceae bacterium]|nr:DUF805 domain-containing protein [Desulfobulbaceae bacterium]
MEQFQRYFLDTLKNRYAAFKGRATRSEYWYFLLFSIIIALILTALDSMIINPLLGIQPLVETARTGILGTLFSFGTLIPSVALAIRRLHDIGKSGWWILLGVIPIVNIIGIFVLLYFFIKDSQPGENQFGLNPQGL